LSTLDVVKQRAATARPLGRVSPVDVGIDLHDRIRTRVRRWGDLGGFEQWHIQSSPGSALRFHADRFALTSQAPGGRINCVAKVRGRICENRPDAAQIYNPGDLHVQIRLPSPESYYVAMLDPTYVQSYAAEAGVGARKVEAYDLQVDHPELVGALQRLHHACQHAVDPLARQCALAQATSAFLERGTEARPVTSKSGNPRALTRAREMLEELYEDAVTLDELCAHAGLSKEHLIRSFGRAYGLPPHQYLMTVRVTRARRLLARGVPSATVATSCGFFDQSHMVRHFRRQLGLTPVAYAKAST